MGLGGWRDGLLRDGTGHGGGGGGGGGGSWRDGLLRDGTGHGGGGGGLEGWAAEGWDCTCWEQLLHLTIMNCITMLKVVKNHHVVSLFRLHHRAKFLRRERQQKEQMKLFQRRSQEKVPTYSPLNGAQNLV